MGMEVGSELAPIAVEAVIGGEASLYGKTSSGPGINQPIKFGSHGDESVKGDVNKLSNVDFPKDATDDWPMPKRIHTFYLVKYRMYDDPKLKSQIDLIDKDIQKKVQARSQIMETLKAKRSYRVQVNKELRSLLNKSRDVKVVFDEKKKEMEPLHNGLGKMRTNRDRDGICSSVEELNDFIYSLHYRMQHESISLTEEKQLLREIKQLEQTREQVIANVAARGKIEESLGSKDEIQEKVKHINADLDEVRTMQQSIWAKIKPLKEELKTIDVDISFLEDDLKVLTEKRDKAIASIQELRKRRDENNACFYKNRAFLSKARELAAKKDIKALEELSHEEVESFLFLWSTSKAFRDDYERRILPSLDSRQLSRDGRMRNPDEKPLVAAAVEAAKPSETQTPIKATSVKQSKGKEDDLKGDAGHEEFSLQKSKKEAHRKPTEKVEQGDLEDREEDLPEPQKDSAGREVDAEKLKEMKREEEIAKAKQAMERKKKLAEKTAAKAAIKAQKEAEKKLKEREKKARKKAAASLPSTDPEETTEGAAEVGQPGEEHVDFEPAILPKIKDQKETRLRYRDHRAKGPEPAKSIPKVILKRKKLTNYWVWAAPAAIFVVLILGAIGYYYFA